MKKITLAISLLILGLSLCKAQTSGCTPDSVAYSYTGTIQSFTVPSCVNSITVRAWGAGGGGGGNDSYNGATGGGGAYASSTISVTPGQVFAVVVGHGGTGGTDNSNGSGGGVGGYGAGNGGDGGNAGGLGSSGAGGAGGGATALVNNGAFLVVAGGGGGGGGGGGYSTPGAGGGGGVAGVSGPPVFNGSCFCTDTGGKGGLINGGIDSLGGLGSNRGTSNDGGGGGGGGGGYNGGGGGGAPDCDCGGGGGAGGNSLGTTIINGNGQTCGNSTYAGLPNGTGVGGVSHTTTATAGGNGYLIISYCTYYQTIIATPVSPSMCSGSYIKLTASGAKTYTWKPATGLTITNDSLVDASPAATTIYTITGTSASGCKDSTTDTVFVYPSNGFDLAGNLTACIDTPGVSNASIQACIFNNRCLPAKGRLKLVLDTAFHITSTTSDSVARTSGDTLYWDYDSLSDIGKTHCVTLNGHISNIPAGDSVFVSMFITPTIGDSNPTNNSVTYWVKAKPYNCVGLPFDPNEKSVSPIGDIADTQKLTYSIHFQNTGTAIAHNVVVIDTLSANLDPTTLKVVSASSEMNTQIVSGHIIKFIFDGINLPDTATSKTTSIGVFSFSIKPSNSVVAGDKITNNAGIYFDANPAIITNKTVNTIAGGPLSIQSFPTLLNITCFPNPFTTSTSIVFNTDAQHYLDLYDIAGRKIESIQCSDKQYELQRGNLAAGVYFIKAYNTNGGYVATCKIVVE